MQRYLLVLAFAAMSEDPRLAPALAKVWPGRATAVVPIEAGITNRNYLFDVDDEETFVKDRQWVRDTWDALRPAAVHDGAYVNLNAEFAGESLRNTYGSAKFDRLRTIKAQYDPTNVFRHNGNIPPA